MYFKPSASHWFVLRGQVSIVILKIENRANENKSCMRVDEREFVGEIHQLSCPGQTRTRVAWELTSESLHESFINSHVLVKREQEFHESWQARVSYLLPLLIIQQHNNDARFGRRDHPIERFRGLHHGGLGCNVFSFLAKTLRIGYPLQT